MKFRFLYLLLGLCWLALPAAGQTKQRKALESQRKEVQKSIEATRKMLTSTGKSVTSSLNQLKLLRAEITSHREVISLLNREINEITREQKAVSDTIYRLTQELGKKKSAYAQAMQQIYRNRSGYETMMFVFSSSSLTQSYRRVRYLQEYSAWRKREAAEIQAQQRVLEEKKEQLNRTMQEKTALLNERTHASNALQGKETAQANLVADLKKKEKELKATLTKQLQQVNALNKEIDRLIAEEARKAAEEARKKSGSGSSGERRSQTPGGYAMTKEDMKLAGDFEKNRGKLPFPLSGEYKIVGRFGVQQHPDFKYVKIDNPGIDLQTKPDTQARAVFDGEVTAVFSVGGDPNSAVIIRHGNYRTIYSNLSQVFVKKGQKVKTRQAIGKIYTDPQDGSTVLGFQLRKENTRLNPEPWLAK